MTTKRAYKLQEFVAHASNVNCLKIGRKSSRVLVTGGEDNKVNLWAIGKPNSILSLSGHSSAIESVSFDSSEILVAAGAASGTIKLWDLEEAKIVRTLTGHRSNCTSVDFHPFGEFFASGSLDTNLKIWDIRRKGCIHTYKSHTRGVNTIRFTPDGRWVVSGGEDNVVKLWDLTAGKLLHDFKCHEGQIQCIDFHPNEFLLATGSADRTVKFWDLETFELIGSTGLETTGVRSMTFNPDGRTLLCGLHEGLKVFSWEPVRSHDSVDIGWSRLADLNVHEGKLLGCSYNQSCVGVWVVDISRLEPYVAGATSKPNGRSTPVSSENLPTNSNNTKASLGRVSISQNPDLTVKETRPPSAAGNAPGTPNRIGLSSGLKGSGVVSGLVSSGATLKKSTSKCHSATNLHIFNKSDVVPIIVPRSSTRDQIDAAKDSSFTARTYPAQSKVIEFRKLSNSRDDSDKATISDPSVSGIDSTKEVSVVGRTYSQSKATEFTKLANIHDDLDRVTISENSVPGVDSTKEATVVVRAYTQPSKVTEYRNVANDRDEHERITVSNHSGSSDSRKGESVEIGEQKILSASDSVNQKILPSERSLLDIRRNGSIKSNSNSCPEPPSSYHDELGERRLRRDVCSIEVARRGRTNTYVANWDKRERPPISEGLTPSNSFEMMSSGNASSFNMRGRLPIPEKETVPFSDEDAIAQMLGEHDKFLGSMHSRMAKIQAIHRLWERNDIKGAISTMEKMSDLAVSADVVSIMVEKTDMITLDLCACLLPSLENLLESKMDRQVCISFEMLLKLVRTFGSVIRTTVSASLSVGVDIQAEQRLERCKLCFTELEKVKRLLPSLIRRGGTVAKSAQEMNLALQDVL